MLISFAIDEEKKLHDVHFSGGCNGNLKAIGKLVEGQDAAHIADVLKGNLCGKRQTSCADQFSIAVASALQQESMREDNQRRESSASGLSPEL